MTADHPPEPLHPREPGHPREIDHHEVTDSALAHVVRAEAGLIVAALHRRIGDFDLSEEAVQEAVAAALRAWRTDGVPPNPGAWLSLTARRKAIDLLRVRSRGERLADALGAEAWTVEATSKDSVDPADPTRSEFGRFDERLPMLFACCHPALAVEARIPLTLRAVVGLTTQEIARAFLVPEPTMAQRLVRAKRKITSSGIPFGVPEGEQLPTRLDDVLTVVAIAYNAGYLEPADAGVAPRPGSSAERDVSLSKGAELAGDAIWLAELVVRELPREPEAWGLLALLTFLSSRTAARFDADGRLVVLAEQDRSRWDTVAVARADGYLARAAAMRRPGRFQLQAAIAGCHASAPTAADTDWLEILILYDMLGRFDPSPVVRLNRAVALAEVAGPAVALADVDQLAERLADYHLFHATRAVLLTRLGDTEAARAANERALALTGNPAEQLLLRTRLPD